MLSKLKLKAIIATLLLPGMVILLIPCLILHSFTPTEWPAVSITTILVTLMAIAALIVLLHCIWDFAFYGWGTLAPLDPPKILIIRGLYRYTRNPMYLAVVCILLAEAWLFSSISMFIYTVLVFLCFHLFVIYYEEPHLRSQFGASYQEYTHVIPRWAITTRPSKPGYK